MGDVYQYIERHIYNWTALRVEGKTQRLVNSDDEELKGKEHEQVREVKQCKKVTKQNDAKSVQLENYLNHLYVMII